ncbi:MCTS1 re-initiation and release factor [Rhinolophus ferrumequinum]|uniref:MCTS1 re-initiation and release factor n=6 Tax=Boreoeutheria TaxID=1437010 RepID=A0A7J8AVB2_RHIFE|nr:MCTS1 re-initiation and release factor [Rhinolophus ferrumequinum]
MPTSPPDSAIHAVCWYKSLSLERVVSPALSATGSGEESVAKKGRHKRQRVRRSGSSQISLRTVKCGWLSPFPDNDYSSDSQCRPSSWTLANSIFPHSLSSPPSPWIMFKKFDEKENVSNCIQLKTSVIKGIKNQLIEQFPSIEPWLNQIMPKKDPVKIVRCHEHIEILTVNGELLFFRQREGPFYPTLRLLHKYPFILPHQQVDKGAIKFVLSGANIMCPGLTSPGAKLYPAAVDTIVAIMAEGKQHALCVGVMKMSAEDIEKVNKGIGIENIHYLNDGLWHMKTYK